MNPEEALRLACLDRACQLCSPYAAPALQFCIANGKRADVLEMAEAIYEFVRHGPSKKTQTTKRKR